MNKKTEQLMQKLSLFLVLCICTACLIVPGYAERTEKSKDFDPVAVAEVILGKSTEKKGVTSVVMGTDKTVTVNEKKRKRRLAFAIVIAGTCHNQA